MREVAERAGVAMSSVSRVLSDHPDVSPEMRAAVMSAVQELGYRPDFLAQGLRNRRTYSIGFTLSDISNPVLAETVKGAERRFREAGYSLLLTDADGNSDLDAAHIRQLEQRSVDGYLLSLADENHPQTAEAIRELREPAVLLDRDRPAGVDIARVSFDHRTGMHEAMRHLLDLGHREVAVITGGPRRPASQRRAGIEDAISEQHRAASYGLYEGEFSIAHGRQATDEILAGEQRPTAIIAAGNMLMHGALLALHDAGIRVGQDISFVGCDSVAVAELHDPPIAVVRRDNVEMGTRAAGLLLARLNGDDSQRDVVLPTEFLARPSCAPPNG
jgi:LacI family transcriptional regulator